MKPVLEGAKCFSATTDLWTSIASHPYLSLTTQFLFMKKMASVDPYKLFTVKMDDKSFKLKEKQFTTVVLSWVFSLFSESIILVSDNGYVEIPNEEGYFIDVDNLTTWTVTGYSMTPTPVAPPPPIIMVTSYSYQPPRAAGRKNCSRKIVSKLLSLLVSGHEAARCLSSGIWWLHQHFVQVQFGAWQSLT